METQLQTYIPLKEAARKYGIPAKVLTRLVEDGIIKLARTEEGDRVIASSTVDNDTAARLIMEEIRPEHYEHLRGEKVRLSEAAEEYGVPNPNLSRWIGLGYFNAVRKSRVETYLDRADIGYIVAIYKRAQELTGSSIKAGWVLKRVLHRNGKA